MIKDKFGGKMVLANGGTAMQKQDASPKTKLSIHKTLIDACGGGGT